MVLLRVISEIRTRTDFKIFCKYTSGEQVVFDLKPMIDAALQKPDGYTEALAEQGFFEKVSLDSYGAPVWPNGFDLCPDTIYLNGKLVGQEAA